MEDVPERAIVAVARVAVAAVAVGVRLDWRLRLDDAGATTAAAVRSRGFSMARRLRKLSDISGKGSGEVQALVRGGMAVGAVELHVLRREFDDCRLLAPFVLDGSVPGTPRGT